MVIVAVDKRVSGYLLASRVYKCIFAVASLFDKSTASKSNIILQLAPRTLPGPLKKYP